MSHERQQIREAIVAALTGQTDADDRVFKTRLAPLQTATLPAICVYNDDEATNEDSKNSAPRELLRTINIAVDVWTLATTEIDDALDDLTLDVETAMDVDTSLSGLAWDSVLMSTEFGLDNRGSRPMGCAHMVYAVGYRVYQRLPELTDKFDSVDAKFTNLGNGAIAPADQVENLVENINQEDT